MAEEYDLKSFDRKMQEMLGNRRYVHTVGVRYTAACLAMAYNADIRQAETAGLLHDCAKKIPDEKKIRLCEKYLIEVTDCERRNPFLLHAKLGAYLAENDFGIKDEDILNSIRYHTTGRPGMTMLEKIIFIADYIEPGRVTLPNLPVLRRLAFQDTDECTYQMLSDTLSYLKERNGEIDDRTRDSLAYYKELHDERKKN